MFLKDVGQVHDGWAVQQNIVHENGRRSVLLSVIKNGNASTLAVVNGVRKVLQVARAAAPPGLKINELFDQSKLVSASIASVLREGAIAAGLTGLMILLFLGSWRSTLIVLISIPLSILASIIVLHFLGHTLNTMTLGGMALAVGILVDDSTVTIEHTHRLRSEGMSLAAATVHGSAGIAVPTMVSTLAISCVFTSVVFLEGPAKFLFTPLGLAVVFAMLASYGLSRTLTPVIIGLLLKGEHHDATSGSGGWFAGLHQAFEHGFELFRRGYVRALKMFLMRRSIIPVVAVLVLALGGVMLTLVGQDFFPEIDGGQIKLHVRAPAATRIETTERIFQEVEDKIREVIPERDRDLIVDDIGVPQRVYNLAFTDGSTIGVNDGVILVSLKEGHAPTSDYVRKLREVLPAAFPSDTFYFPGCRRRSTSASSAATGPPIWRSRISCGAACRPFQASPTLTSSRSSMRRPSWPRSTGPEHYSSVSARKRSRTISTSVSARRNRSSPISGPIRSMGSPITSRCRRPSIW